MDAHVLQRTDRADVFQKFHINEDKSKEKGAISSRQGSSSLKRLIMIIRSGQKPPQDAFKCLPTAGILNEADVPRVRNGSGIPSRTPER